MIFALAARQAHGQRTAFADAPATQKFEDRSLYSLKAFRLSTSVLQATSNVTNEISGLDWWVQ
jgi:hypothetical protein